MAKLIANVWLRGHGWFGPAYPDNGNPPAELVTNPKVWDSAPSADKPAEPEPKPAKPSLNPLPSQPGPPPKAGKGSSDAAWTAYARSQGVDVSEEMRRNEVIAACEQAGVPTE